jgi:rifampicin phosphotransferase
MIVEWTWLRSGCRYGYTTSLFLIMMALPALAIPSPEIVIGAATSLSQLVAFLSAALGGGALLMRGGRSARSIVDMRREHSLRWCLIGLAVALVISGAGHVYHWERSENTSLGHLQATLLRPSRDAGRPARDPTLKELSYGQQTRHRLGISTADAQLLLDQIQAGHAGDTIVLDVRERAEAEMGGLIGSVATRFPDFDVADARNASKKFILFCHNGNRSHETCENLAALGIDCRFIVGGLEKWVVENRPIAGQQARSLDELRAIPAYAAQRVLLDTRGVNRLVDQEKAVFVDVRYPGEFAAGHLPGAINLSLRRLSTVDLQSEIESLPKRPIIAPCYDRQSCFFAEALGLELTRAGHDFRGRYTVPWEYFVASGRPPHVEDWIADQQRSWWSRLTAAAASALTRLAEVIGLPMAILLLAFASRLCVLPFSIKAEKDQLKAAAISTGVATLRNTLKNDPHRLARAMRNLYRRHQLTPGRNLLALLFLPLMTLALTAIQNVSAQSPVPFLWLADLSARDPTLIFPILFGCLVSIYLHLIVSPTRRNQFFVWFVGLPLLIVAAAVLGSGANLYMMASASLLLLQRAALRISRASISHLVRRFEWPRVIVPLSRPDLLKSCGNKAYRLAQLAATGVKVPRGCVLTTRFLQTFERSSPRRRRWVLALVWWRLGARAVAVRSSAAGEDGAGDSYAGVFESRLHVGRRTLVDAVQSVLSSFDSIRARSYGASGGGSNIIIQTMVEADYAGVFFTQHPAAAGMGLVEIVRGTADGYVSGREQAESYRFGRYSHKPIGDQLPPIDLEPLLRIGRHAEELFGLPQDIEWTFAAGQFQIVQSRDITARISAAADATVATEEWNRVLSSVNAAQPDDVVFYQNELAELLPRPTPLSLSLMQAFWKPGGSMDLACRRLGITYDTDETAPNAVVTVFGRLYIDTRAQQATTTVVSPRTLKRLAHEADQIERQFRESFLPQFLDSIRIMEVADFDKLPSDELMMELARVSSEFVLCTHVEVDAVNIVASLLFDKARSQAASEGLDPAQLLAKLPDTVVNLGKKSCVAMSDADRVAHLARVLGHRAALDYELAEPRFADSGAALSALAQSIQDGPLAQSDEAWALPVPGGSVALNNSVRKARRFQTLKEDAKHHSLRQLAVLRHLVLSVGRRFDLGDLVFFLTFDELLDATALGALHLRRIADERKKRRSILLKQPSRAPRLIMHNLELLSAGDAPHHAASIGGGILGTRVSGSSSVTGRAYKVSQEVAELGLPLDDFQNGDVIVSPMIHPNWLPSIQRSGGLVCEIGGWLSHIAILAREFDIVMVVGATGLASIQHGAFVHIALDGRVTMPSNDDKPAATDAIAAAAE